VIILVSDFS